MIELLKSWWNFLHDEDNLFWYGVNANKFFWYDLTEKMEAQDWRSPWGIFRSANLAHDYGSQYEGWTIPEIYSLFCDEDRYTQHRENEGRID